MESALLAAGLLLCPMAAIAAASCVPAPAAGAEGVRLEVRTFGPDGYDLALQAEAPHRLSFSGASSACHYRPLAVARGGDWGWHLLWSEQDRGVFYARIDGAAWVSSPSKKITAQPAEDVRLRVDGELLEISWQDADGRRARRLSSDGGRSWEPAGFD